AAIRSIVFDEISRQGLMNDQLSSFGEIVPKSKMVKQAKIAIPEGLISEGGIQRLGSTNSTLSRRMQKTAGPFAPDPQQMMDPAGVGEESGMPMDPSM